MIKKKTETQSPLYLDLFSHRYISELSCFSLMHYSISSIQVNKYNNPHICHWATVGLIWLYFTLFSDTVNTLKKKNTLELRQELWSLFLLVSMPLILMWNWEMLRSAWGHPFLRGQSTVDDIENWDLISTDLGFQHFVYLVI